MHLQENQSLQPYNTFGIKASARYFTEVSSAGELEEITRSAAFKNHPHLVLGGGSNILFTGDYDGLVIRNAIKGIQVLEEDDEHALVRAGAGEIWHGFVLHCIAKGFGGLENLSLIPGNVGASPMQNIGAYGVEVKETVTEVEGFSLRGRVFRTFSNAECRFGYRDSIFKQEEKGKYMITAVTYRLSKKPQFNITYGTIARELEAMGVQELSLRAVSDAVIRIRQSKLPDPAKIGNAGSFFKNPVISTGHYDKLKAEFPDMPGYAQEDGVKVPAGWLIEQSGWKGKRFGDAGVHAMQALVLVNYGHARGSEIFDLSEQILQSVQSRYGITLEREVNII